MGHHALVWSVLPQLKHLPRNSGGTKNLRPRPRPLPRPEEVQGAAEVLSATATMLGVAVVGRVVVTAGAAMAA